MRLPAAVSMLLSSDDLFADHGSTSQAFALLTVAESGHPHVCLLSVAQVDVSGDDETVFVSIAGRTTCQNLLARGLATLIAIEGATAHYVKASVAFSTVVGGRMGFALAVDELKADSAGVELRPLSFRFSPELAIEERWSADETVLAALRAQGLTGQEGQSTWSGADSQLAQED
jgi:hypothetical protein